jgi:hypothetical protein
MLVSQTVRGLLRIIYKRDRKFEFVQHLGHEPGGLLIWAEKQGLIAHAAMVGTPVCTSKLLM